tara:strand:- start:353 stop:1621 length:1269 start_codon:yes stop_codon:yes gene_type:complete
MRVELVNTNSELDITSLVQSVSLTENVFQSCNTCNVLCLDSSKILELFPVMGQEEIRIIPSSENNESGSVGWSFYIYAIKEFTDESNNRKSYNLCGISSEYLRSIQKRVSKSYVDLLVSSMVEDIAQKELGITFAPKNFQKTEGQCSLIIPNKTPLDAISWLCSRAVSSGASNYVFFKGLDGFVFRSLEDLIKEPSAETYVRLPTTNIQFPEDNSFMIMETNDRFDNMVSIEGGMYSSETITHSLVERSYDIHKFDYLNEFGNGGTHNTLGTIKLMNDSKTDRYKFNESSESRKFLIPSALDTYNKKMKSGFLGLGSVWKNKSSNDRSTILPIRTSQLHQINSNKVSIEIKGNFNRKAGEIITLKDRVDTQVDEMRRRDSPTKDKHISYVGRQYVLGVKHLINKQEIRTILHLAKDGYDKQT